MFTNKQLDFFSFFEKVALLCGLVLKKYCFLHKDFIVNIATIIAWEFLTLVPCYGLTIVLFCSEYEKCISLSSLLKKMANLLPSGSGTFVLK